MRPSEGLSLVRFNRWAPAQPLARAIICSHRSDSPNIHYFQCTVGVGAAVEVMLRFTDHAGHPMPECG
jgi:hypothetical protein